MANDAVTAAQVEICQEIFIRQFDKLQQGFCRQAVKLRTGIGTARVQEMDETGEGT